MSRHTRSSGPTPGKGGFFSGGGIWFIVVALIVIAWFVWTLKQVS